MKPNVLVTGAAGYIGSIATEILLKENYNVITLDDLSTGHKDAIFNNAPFFKGSVGNINLLEDIFSKNKIDVVLHFAGFTLVEESVREPHKYLDNNFCQPQNMLDVMIRCNVRKIVFSSTCAVYGEPNKDEIPIKEETRTKPINPYGQSKLFFEQALRWYKNKHNLNYIALRYFNVAGASETRGEKHNPETHLIPLVIRALKDKNYKLSMYGNDYPTTDGTAIRDYIHVVDLIYSHINAIDTLLNNKEHSNIYNVGYGHGYSVLEIINAACKVFKKDISYKICERRPGDPPVLIADSSKIKKELNWKPRLDNIHEIIRSASKFIN